MPRRLSAHADVLLRARVPTTSAREHWLIVACYYSMPLFNAHASRHVMNAGLTRVSEKSFPVPTSLVHLVPERTQHRIPRTIDEWR